MLVLLDSGPLGLLVHTSRGAQLEEWVDGLRAAGHDVGIPAIVYYELRRELLRAQIAVSLSRLDRAIRQLMFADVSLAVLQRASELWAITRQQGLPTAADAALDVDVILAATALELAQTGLDVVVATSNVAHLSRFVDAREWAEVRP